MNLLHDIPQSALQFYLTAPYSCSYLPQQQARSQVAVPGFLINSQTYSELVQRGFRRSGTFTYRPHCDACQACVPVRIEVASFVPGRAQRRTARRHRNLVASLHTLGDSEEHFNLYQRYQAARHADEGKESEGHGQYRNFLLQSHVDTLLVEFCEGNVLRMVSIVDILDDGLSSVYTFYDPDVPQSSFGTYNILWQIELCRKLNLDFVYLGFWIKESKKMAYKAGYQPLQGLVDGEWKRLF